MKILHVNPSEAFPRRFTLNLSFDSSTGILSGTIGTHTIPGDLIKDFSLDLNKWKGKIVEAAIFTTNQGYEIGYYDVFKNYSMGNGMPSGWQNRDGQLIVPFRVVVHENLDDSLIQIKNGHDSIEGFENIAEEGDPGLGMYNLVQHDELAAKLAKLAKLKSDMLGVIDQRDSVSYLEAQVDILTRLVLALHKDSTDPLISILQQADENSVLAIKGEEALSKEFLNKKAWVRTVQKDYYAAKEEITA